MPGTAENPATPDPPVMPAPGRPAPRRALACIGGGTALLVAWGMLFWAVLYKPLGVFDPLTPGVKAAATALKAAETPTGTYFVPWPRDTAQTRAAFVAGHKAGHFFKLSYIAEGHDPESPGKLLGGTAHNAFAVMLAALVLILARGGALSRGRRFALVLTAGLMGTWLGPLGDPVWFHLPTHHALCLALYDAVAWALVGLCLTHLWPAPSTFKHASRTQG